MALSDAHKILIFGAIAVASVAASSRFTPLILVALTYLWVAWRRWIWSGRGIVVTAGILGAIGAGALLMVGATQLAESGTSGSEFAVAALPVVASLGALVAFTTVSASQQLRADGKRGLYPLFILVCAAGLAAWYLLVGPALPAKNDGRLGSTDYVPENYCLTGSKSAYKIVKLHKSKGESLEPYRQDRATNPVGPAAPGTKDCQQPLRYILYP